MVAVHLGDRILMLRQSYQPRWTLPGGGIELGETALEAAARELREDIGIDARPGDLVASIKPSLVYTGRRDTVQFFVLRCVREPVIVIDEREIVEARWVSLAESRQMRVAPHIRDYLRIV